MCAAVKEKKFNKYEIVKTLNNFIKIQNYHSKNKIWFSNTSLTNAGYDFNPYLNLTYIQQTLLN